MESIPSIGGSKAERDGKCGVKHAALSDDAIKLGFSLKEAAHVSGLSRSLLYVAIGQGALPARKCGARTLILAADLRRFLHNLPRMRAVS
jgi:hypothetical protein